MATMTKQEAVDVLTNVKERILEALEEARTALQDAARDEWGSAEAYWWAHIRCALDDNHEYLGGSMETLQDTINALEESEEE